MNAHIIKPDEIGKWLTDDTFIVNLWLTEQCNFACAHCFYACSPQGQKGYMSDAMLRQVRSFVRRAREFAPRVTVNLIGGEPTLNMKEFKRCLDEVWEWHLNDYGIEVEMTTNGWWLHKAKTARQFLEAVQRCVQSDGSFDEGFRVRISDSQYHRDFRPGYLQRKGVGGLLSELFETGSINDEPVTFEEICNCAACGHTWNYHGEEQCPECESDDLYEPEYRQLIEIAPPHDGAPWIYVEDHLSDINVIPSNPERGSWGGNDMGRTFGRHGCGHHTIVTFDPKGNLRDGCCRGSDMPFGTVEDHPFVLLGLTNTFLRTYRPSCYDCRADSVSWRDTPEYAAARRYYEHVASELVHDDEEDEFVYTEPEDMRVFYLTQPD